MRAWLISDTHLTHAELIRPDRITIPDADICICAGDISGNVDMSMDFLARHIAPRMPVVATLGNHDYYGSTINQALVTAKQRAVRGVHIRRTKDAVSIKSELWARRCRLISNANTGLMVRNYLSTRESRWR